MMDSITIAISRFVLYSDEFFTKAQYQELKGQFGVFGRHVSRYTDYPQKCKAEGRYFPQVHIVEKARRRKGGMVPVGRKLLVQVSVPKLLFGASIFDTDERLLPLVAQKLAETLKEIRVGVDHDEVLSAVVHRIDYAKMLQISPSYGSTASMLRELAAHDMKQSSDFNRRDYHDGKDGFYLKFWNSSQGFVIYDKFDEILVNGKTKLEQEIAEQYRAGKWKKGAMRIEVSLQKKQTVEGELRKHYPSKSKDFTFREAAKADIAKACVLRIFDNVYLKGFNRLVRLSGLKNAELLRFVEENADGFKERAALFYLAHRVKSVGLGKAVGELERDTSPATTRRYKRMVEAVLEKAGAKKDVVNVVSYLRRKLEKFQPVLPKSLAAILGGAGETEE